MRKGAILFVAFIFLLPVLNAGEEDIALGPVKSFFLEGNIATIERSNAGLEVSALAPDVMKVAIECVEPHTFAVVKEGGADLTAREYAE